MTWVIGANTLFGYGLVISDTCVTFADGSTADLLQKAYPIGYDMLGGFAGNIKNGFILLDDLRRSLHVDDPDMAWEPEMVAEQWPKRARLLYEEHPEYVRGEHEDTHILISGVYPDKDNSLGYPMTMGAIFKSPSFTPEFFFDFRDIFSIGSGNDVEEFKSTLIELKKDFAKFLNHESGKCGRGGFGTIISTILSMTIFKKNAVGISPHTHRLFIGRGEYGEANSEHNEFLGTGEIIAVHKMPKVAKSWNELLEMIQDNDRANSAKA